MAALLSILPLPTRIVRSTPIRSTICAQCRRSFTASATLPSGHSKWSKIKHEKAAADKKKTARRNVFAKQLMLYSRLYGPDPNMNGQLAYIISTAKKAGVPKTVIDAAIARGQGKSGTGAGLETATLEVMLPPAVAMVIDIETEGKQRALHELRDVVRKNGGTVTPTAFLFARRGRVVLDGRREGERGDAAVVSFDDAMILALDAGAEDVERDADDDDDSGIVIWTPPNLTHQVAQKLAKSLDARILSSDIIWSCASDKVKVDDSETAGSLAKLLAAITDYPDVSEVYINAERGDASEEAWSAVEEALDS
ncbi:putative yfcA protein [Rosellinia necatrix]|uniref:Putative yfcA protein n=1 Tax=Rosellinia necatrix TaxID=77044 RepID=A0A1W2TH20_ROSNE|nr:putative yfcA protein [Rosellinia necatrix]